MTQILHYMQMVIMYRTWGHTPSQTAPASFGSFNRLIKWPWIAVLVLCVGCAGVSRYTVTRVIDGDTIEVTDTGGIRTTIRLRNFNAPEMDEPGGLEARARLVILVEGKRVLLEPKARDVYGRTVAHVTDHSEDVGVMLKEAAARERTK